MTLKKVKHLLPATLVDMDGFPVKQALPTEKVPQIDPYLLLHHAVSIPLDDRPARVQGIGPHPHRGFSPVTFVVEGTVHHRDSRGNSQVAKAGDVQWMHTGMGIIHSERPSEESVDSKEKQEIIQLWINSPAQKKMLQPDYQYLIQSEMPFQLSADGKVISHLVAGDYNGNKGKIRTQSEIIILWVRADEKGNESYEIPTGFSTALYLIKGSLRLKGFGIVDPESLLVFGEEGNLLEIESTSSCQFIILAGKPIGEKVVQQGPFVMNSETEIMQAMRDYQMGKMGYLVEE